MNETEAQDVDDRIVGPTGRPPDVLVPGRECPRCGAGGEYVEASFGGGGKCIKCGAMSDG